MAIATAGASHQFTLPLYLISIGQSTIEPANNNDKNWEPMQKYLAIIDRKTGYVLMLCMALTWVCRYFQFSFNLNIMLFSIAVIFPLVFTIREAFKRRDAIIRLLSRFKSSINAAYYCFANNNKLPADKKTFIGNKLQVISLHFFNALRSHEYDSGLVRDEVNQIFTFLDNNRDTISNGTSLKIMRFLKDVHESIENTVGLKMHGTPISLRAYCLVFIYIFPFVFVPTLVYDLAGSSAWVVYALSAMHGFILISLYNVQDAMEDPFDQIGLDDIKLEEFHFQHTAAKDDAGTTH